MDGPHVNKRSKRSLENQSQYVYVSFVCFGKYVLCYSIHKSEIYREAPWLLFWRHQ